MLALDFLRCKDDNKISEKTKRGVSNMTQRPESL
jgi:hypothetical protein